MSHARRPLAFAALALVAACGGSDRVAGPATPQLDPSAVLNGMANAARFGSTGVAGAGGTPVLFAITTAPGGSALAGLGRCPWVAAAQAFQCAPTTRQGVTVTVAYTALDARGAVLSAPTPATTDAIRTVLTATGTNTVALPDGRSLTYTLDQRHDATLRGFLAGPRVLDGVMTSRTRASGSALGAVPAGDLQLTQTTRGLTFPAGGAGYPTAGTITTELAGGAAAPFSTQVLTFDGTSTVRLALTLPGGATRQCTLDLAATTPASALRCDGA